MPTRLNYEDSCRSLQEQGWLKHGDIPPLPERPPAYDDEALGVEFFRTCLDGKEGAEFQNLTLPRTYFGRSDIIGISFVDSDLSESVANWNDFKDNDFSSADLSRTDFRGCQIIGTKFVDTLLIDADLRCCSFEGCDFTNADMTRTKLTRDTGVSLQLSDSQKAVIDWREDDGEEPGGG